MCLLEMLFCTNFPRQPILVSRPPIYLSIDSTTTDVIIEKSRHAFSFALLPSRISLPLQCPTSDLTTSHSTPTRRDHRLPKHDARVQRDMLGSDPRKGGHEILPKHMEQDNNNLQTGRMVGQLLHAAGRCTSRRRRANSL